MLNKPLRVFICDLTHDTVVLVSDTIPINIGFIGSYAKKIHDKNIEISLFKYPKTVLQAIEANPPDIIALSNYSWNSQLSERIAQLAKEKNPNTITVQGGTNFPHKEPRQLEFLLNRPYTDIYVELEAELSFSELIDRVLQARDGGPRLFDQPINGCVYIAPETRKTADPKLIKGEPFLRIKNLNDIPSPYLNGMLDQFFDGRLTPFIETNRGCPFTCSFCHTGAEFFQKINMFSLDRVKEEIAYIAPRAAALGIVNLHLADTNFAMYQRDRDICEAFLDSQRRYNWPRQVMSTTGKNNKERVIEITKMMGNVFSVNMSVQSMDTTVLKNIKRQNIRLNDYIKINQSLKESGRSTKGEVIIGLPGETKESFVEGLKRMIESGVSSVCSYTLMLLHGTEFKDPDYRRQFDIKGKYRIVPLNFGEYSGERVFDVEEVGISTNSMSHEDYLWIRGFCLIVEILHNNRPFDEILRYGTGLGLERFKIIETAYNSLKDAPREVQDVFHGYMSETQSELWESEEELIAFYRQEENYKRLFNGEVGGNLIYKYKAISLAFCTEVWPAFLGKILKRMLRETQGDLVVENAETEIDILVDFVKNKLAGVLNAQADIQPRYLKSSYDIKGWLKGPDETLLTEFKLIEPITYLFEYTEDQIGVREDYFRRYGTHANALSKIVTRVSNVESLFRKVQVLGEMKNYLQSKEKEEDQFIRYTLSN